MTNRDNLNSGIITTAGCEIEPLDPGSFSTFGINGLKHNYHLHPMMQLDKLEELAHFMLKKGKCRFVSPDIELDSEFLHHGSLPDDKDLSQVFAEISKPRSWIALYNIEVNPEYRRFLNEVIDKLRPLVEPEQKRIFDVRGFIFISAPPSVTPFHIDRENNFWLQIKGQKNITVFDHRNRDVVSAKAVEEFFIYRSLDDVRLDLDMIDQGMEFVTSPGDGLYFPSTTPHMTTSKEDWVTPDDGVSISIGIVFYTDFTRNQARIHQTNHAIRKLGVTPAEPGNSTIRDLLKQTTGYAITALKTRFRGYSPPPGIL